MIGVSSGTWDDFNYTDNTNSSLLTDLLREFQSTCKQSPPSVENLHWTLAGSMFFAFQVMTTIGYGTFAPATPGGRAFTVIFGAAGIVITGFILGVFTSTIDALLEKLHYKLYPKAYHERSAAIRFKMVFNSLLLVVYLLVVAAIAAAVANDAALGFGEALYFAFITVSTVGLGDFTMSAATEAAAIMQFILFLPGLALFAEFVNLGNESSEVADEMMAKKSGSFAKRLKVSKVSSVEKVSAQYEQGEATKE